MHSEQGELEMITGKADPAKYYPQVNFTPTSLKTEGLGQLITSFGFTPFQSFEGFLRDSSEIEPIFKGQVQGKEDSKIEKRDDPIKAKFFNLALLVTASGLMDWM